MDLASCEMFFYGGIAIAAAAGILALICAIIFAFTGKRLRKRLEQEYGKPRI